MEEKVNDIMKRIVDSVKKIKGEQAEKCKKVMLPSNSQFSIYQEDGKNTLTIYWGDKSTKAVVIDLKGNLNQEFPPETTPYVFYRDYDKNIRKYKGIKEISANNKAIDLLGTVAKELESVNIIEESESEKVEGKTFYVYSLPWRKELMKAIELATEFSTIAKGLFDKKISLPSGAEFSISTADEGKFFIAKWVNYISREVIAKIPIEGDNNFCDIIVRIPRGEKRYVEYNGISAIETNNTALELLETAVKELKAIVITEDNYQVPKKNK